MFSTRSQKRAYAGLAGGTTFYLLGGLDFSFQIRENTLNQINETLTYAVKKITALNPADLVDLLAKPDDAKIPGTVLTVGSFKEAYNEMCGQYNCPNYLTYLSDACQGKLNFPVTDIDTGMELGEVDVAGLTQGVSNIAINQFKQQALAILGAGQKLLQPGLKGFFDSPLGQVLEHGADNVAKGAIVIGSGLSFFAAEAAHDHFHANENSTFAYILCGIVGAGSAYEAEKHFSRALSLVTTGQSALSSFKMGFAVMAIGCLVQFGIRELEEPTVRNRIAGFFNSAINFISNNSKLLLTGAVVATVGGVGALAYASSKK